jgi:hypothetical protein
MIKSLLAAALLLSAADPSALSAADTGVNGASLSATPRTSRIPMCLDAARYNQLSLTLTVTAGSSTTTVVKCFESETGNANTWAQISICDGNAAAACAPDTRTYTLSEYDTQNSKKVIDSNWRFKKCYALCTATASGTGTVVITGTRSWQ